MSARNSLRAKAERRESRDKRHTAADEQRHVVGRFTVCRCCGAYKRTGLESVCGRCVKRLASLWGAALACRQCGKKSLLPDHRYCRRCIGRAVGSLRHARW